MCVYVCVCVSPSAIELFTFSGEHLRVCYTNKVTIGTSLKVYSLEDVSAMDRIIIMVIHLQ